MAETISSQHIGTGGIVSNSFGEHYLFDINRNLFQGTDASTVFRSYFGESLFEEDAFYIIAGTDSGLLYQYVKLKGIPKGSRYLFLELPEVLALLENMDDPQEAIVVAIGDNWLKRAEEMEVEKYALMGRLTLVSSLGIVHGHYSDYPTFWRKIKAEYDAYLENINIIIRVRPFLICQIENLTENQVPATCLKNTFRGKTAVVLAGGPSLDDLLPWVRQHRQDLLVIAVSRISRSLLQAGIQPDISVSVDPQPFNLNVCRDMLEFQEGTLLANNYHLSPNLLASWGGQKVFIGPRYPWPTPLQPEFLPQCGGTTVTNTALDIAVNSGVAQIVLGGADFCFNQAGYTHASGTAEQAIGPMLKLCDQQVETNSGMMADTENGYLESGKHIDLQAQDAVAKGCRVINPAPGAMHLPNVEHITVDAIQIEPMELPARVVLANCVPTNDSAGRVKLYKEELGEVNRVLKELSAIKQLSNKALKLNSKIYTKRQNESDPSNSKVDPITAKKVDSIDEQLNTKYATTIEFIKRFDVSRFLKILRLDIKQIEQLVENSQVYFQSLVATSDEITNLLRIARTRIMSRLEEEKPQPNIIRLLNQWRSDQQPGRASLWARRHANYIGQLPNNEQQALTDFANTFDDVVDELGKGYISSIEKDANLDGVAGRAREYFMCLDQAGLLRVLSGLQSHNDQKKAAYFIPLVHGYLAELRNQSEEAIDAYRSIDTGSTYLDALMRLFELYTKTQDWDSALDVLKKLSTISATYSPMYADLLYSTGDIDNAVEIYTEYLLANPEDLSTMMKLGKLFLECGSEEGVEWTMNYILGKDPGNQTAHQILNEKRLSVATNSTRP